MYVLVVVTGRYVRDAPPAALSQQYLCLHMIIGRLLKHGAKPHNRTRSTELTSGIWVIISVRGHGRLLPEALVTATCSDVLAAEVGLVHADDRLWCPGVPLYLLLGREFMSIIPGFFAHCLGDAVSIRHMCRHSCI